MTDSIKSMPENSMLVCQDCKLFIMYDNGTSFTDDEHWEIADTFLSNMIGHLTYLNDVRVPNGYVCCECCTILLDKTHPVALMQISTPDGEPW